MYTSSCIREIDGKRHDDTLRMLPRGIFVFLILSGGYSQGDVVPGSSPINSTGAISPLHPTPVPSPSGDTSENGGRLAVMASEALEGVMIRKSSLLRLVSQA